MVPKCVRFLPEGGGGLASILHFLHMLETVGERRRSKRDEHNERSDSQDVAEVDKAALSVSEEDNRFGSLASLPLASIAA